MRRPLLFIAAIFITSVLFAQAPQKMSYQAVIRDNSGQLVNNQSIGMQISILQGSPTGSAVYVETHTTTTNANGLASLEIGTGAATGGSVFSSIDWANGPYFIKTETDINGGTDYTITGTNELLSVPYALHANRADLAIQANKADSAIYFESVKRIEIRTSQQFFWGDNDWMPVFLNDAFYYQPQIANRTIIVSVINDIPGGIPLPTLPLEITLPDITYAKNTIFIFNLERDDPYAPGFPLPLPSPFPFQVKLIPPFPVTIAQNNYPFLTTYQAPDGYPFGDCIDCPYQVKLYSSENGYFIY